MCRVKSVASYWYHQARAPATMQRLTRKGWLCAMVLASLLLGCSGELSHHPLCESLSLCAVIPCCSIAVCVGLCALAAPSVFGRLAR